MPSHIPRPIHYLDNKEFPSFLISRKRGKHDMKQN